MLTYSKKQITLISVINDLQTYVNTTNEANNGVHAKPQKIIDAFNLYIGTRYPSMEGFLELDVVKEQFPAMIDAKNAKNNPTTYTGTNKEPEDKTVIDTDTPLNNADDLQKLNKSFPGSSGSSDAIGT